MAPIPLSGCIVLNEDKTAMLVLRRTKKQWYEIPGGKIEPGETQEKAAQREFLEEAGCEVTIIKKLGFCQFENEYATFHANWFLAKIQELQNPVVNEPDKFDQIIFIPFTKLENYDLSPNITLFLEEYKKGKITF